ncbi:acylphosphatase [Candidatus Omnitrophota bacterium]
MYKGRVQGIGFRFSVERIALNYEVVGWVKNLAGGDVEVVAEADEDTINNFLKTVRGYFMKYIVDEHISTLEATSELKDFQMKF